MKFRRPHKANVDMAGKILTWRENSAASQSKRAWNAPWNAPSPPRIFSCRHDNVMTTRDKNRALLTMASAERFIEIVEEQIPQIINEAIIRNTKTQTNWSVAIFKRSDT